MGAAICHGPLCIRWAVACRHGSSSHRSSESGRAGWGLLSAESLDRSTRPGDPRLPGFPGRAGSTPQPARPHQPCSVRRRWCDGGAVLCTGSLDLRALWEAGGRQESVSSRAWLLHPVSRHGGRRAVLGRRAAVDDRHRRVVAAEQDPVRWYFRPTVWPVWNHRIQRRLRIYFADTGADKHAWCP